MIHSQKFFLCWPEAGWDYSDYNYTKSEYSEAELLEKYKIIGNVKSEKNARACAIVLRKLL